MTRTALLIGLCLLVGCGRSPEPDFYMLTPVAGEARDAVYTIKIDRPALPAYLDRPDMVWQNNERLEIDEMKNWIAPLDRMFERVLAEDLRQRLPSCLIVTEADDIPLPVRFIVETDIQQFNAVDDDRVILKGQFLVKDKQASQQWAANLVQLTAISESATSSRVEALSGLVGQMADQIAAQLQSETEPVRNKKF